MPICTVSMCYDGRAAVQRMRSTFDYLSTKDGFNKANYEATVISIESALSAADSWYATLIPFDPICCTIGDIGNQADSLTNSMLASVGASSIDVPKPPLDLSTLLLIGGIIALAIVYSPQIKTVFKKG